MWLLIVDESARSKHGTTGLLVGCSGTQCAANAELVPISMFRYLWHLPMIKRQIVAQAMGRE